MTDRTREQIAYAFGAEAQVLGKSPNQMLLDLGAPSGWRFREAAMQGHEDMAHLSNLLKLREERLAKMAAKRTQAGVEARAESFRGRGIVRRLLG